MYQRGEDVIVGLGIEETRGTPVEPQMWVPGRSPSGITAVVDKSPVKETRGSKVATNASEIVQSRAEGDLEFNVRAKSIGYILKSLFGSSSPAAVMGQSGVYDHTFSVLQNDPEHPALTIGLSQPSNQDYAYPLAVAGSIEIKITPDDLVNAVVSFIASKEQEKEAPAYAPSFDSEDYYFRHQDAVIKIADDLASLGAATPRSVKEFSLSIPNGARPDQNIAELNPGNVLAMVFEPKGVMTIDLQDTELHDIFTAGSYKAVQITLTRGDITIGSTAHPTLTITMPRVSFEKWDPNRPIDDVVAQKIEFMAHYDETSGKAIEAVLRNKVVDYTPEESGS